MIRNGKIKNNEIYEDYKFFSVFTPPNYHEVKHGL